MLSPRSAVWIGPAALVVAASLALGANAQDGFPHEDHKNLFPSCLTCHAGAARPGEPMWPAVESCASCHDGTVEESVDWSGATLAVTNLSFEHGEHRDTIRGAGNPALACRDCHAQPETHRMEVQLASAEQCLDCHEAEAPHLELAGTDCESCHLPLAASELTLAMVADFPVPPSHEQEDRFRDAHGELAESGAGVTGVDGSCATCHARDFCIQCHVDAPEQSTIVALALDPRSLAHEAELWTPVTHEEESFLFSHGEDAGGARCSTCHTRESCTECHLGTPEVARSLYTHEQGRGRGAAISRHEPPSHTEDYVRDGHASSAVAATSSCAACHVRNDCFSCHLPGPTEQGGYHEEGFIATHPASAYSQQRTCADCHNTGWFCQSCHEAAGLTSAGNIDAGYHDAKGAFLGGHGVAARQSLESCVSCHAEGDCLQCHSALGGRRFSPHGPGFDPERLGRSNPEMCVTCHGRSIPGLN